MCNQSLALCSTLKDSKLLSELTRVLYVTPTLCLQLRVTLSLTFHETKNICTQTMILQNTKIYPGYRSVVIAANNANKFLTDTWL